MRIFSLCGRDLAPIFGDLSQSDTLSEIKPPLSHCLHLKFLVSLEQTTKWLLNLITWSKDFLHLLHSVTQSSFEMWIWAFAIWSFKALLWLYSLPHKSQTHFWIFSSWTVSVCLFSFWFKLNFSPHIWQEYGLRFSWIVATWFRRLW